MDQNDSKVTFIYLNAFKVTLHITQVTSKLPKNHHFSEGCSSSQNPSGTLDPSKYVGNECFLNLGPFRSDQSRHVDDFGAKTRNVDGILVEKVVFSMT